MAEVFIPLSGGVHQEADAKLLPDGLFARAENVRVRTDGRLEVRYGYRRNDATFANADAPISFAHGDALISIAERTSGPPGYVRARARTVAGDVTNTDLNMTGTASSLGGLFAGVRRDPVYAGAPTITMTDCVLGADGLLWVLVCRGTSLYTVHARDPNSGAVIRTFSLSEAPTNPKMVRVGPRVVCVYGSGIAIKQFAIETSSYSYATTAITGITEAPDIYVGVFDVCPQTDTNYGLVVQGNSSALVCSIVAATAVGTEKFWIDPIAVGDLCLSLAWILNYEGNERFCVAYVRTGYDAGAIGVYSATGTLIRSLALSYCVLSPSSVAKNDSGGEFTVCVNYKNLSTATAWGLSYRVSDAEITVDKTIANMWFVSRPGKVGIRTYVWAVDNAYDGGEQRTYHLIGYHGPGASHTLEATACVLEGRVPALGIDGRSNFVATYDRSTDRYLGYCVLPTCTSYTMAGADLLTVDLGTYTTSGAVVQINGQSIVPGAVVREWSGSKLVESGLGEGPRRVQATAVSGAGVDIGAHQYVVVWEWRDERGRIHRSPPSIPVAVTTSSGLQRVQVDIDAITSTSKPDVMCVVYRTLAGGTVFYWVDQFVCVANTVGRYPYVDYRSDASIAQGRVLYTQGTRGAQSGLLPNYPPPAARYACVSASRVLLGGLEDRSAVQWSKLVYPGEPVQWSIDTAFRLRVEGEVTGVAQLDGTWFVFTRDAIWQVVGDGPDDTGVGAFSEPRRLPSNTGCISHKSIVECADGLLFQGRNHGIWLLPRGGNSPAWIGQSVRDTLEESPNVTSATLVQTEGCAYFAVSSLAPTVVTGTVDMSTVNLANIAGKTLQINLEKDTRFVQSVGVTFRSSGLTVATLLDDINASGYVVASLTTGNRLTIAAYLVHKLELATSGTVSLAALGFGTDTLRIATETRAKLLVFDTRNHNWYIDTIERRVHTATTWLGALVMDSTLEQSVGVYTDDQGGVDSAVIGEIQTGDLRPFGPAGWGRVRMLHLFGTQSGSLSSNVWISYDSGATWTDSYAWTFGSAERSIDLQFGPSRVRGCEYRIRVRVPASLKLHALGLEAYKSAGIKRLPAAQRG